MAHLARGARGKFIRDLLTKLLTAPSEESDPAFDEFTPELEAKLKADHGAIVVDETLYHLITGNDFPELFDRMVMAVGVMEGHGYFTRFKLGSKGDVAGITMGIAGFQADSGTLMTLFKEIPENVRQTALDNAGVPPGQQALFTKFLTTKGGAVSDKLAKDLFSEKGAVLPHWKRFFRAVLKSDEGDRKSVV